MIAAFFVGSRITFARHNVLLLIRAIGLHLSRCNEYELQGRGVANFLFTNYSLKIFFSIRLLIRIYFQLLIN